MTAGATMAASLSLSMVVYAWAIRAFFARRGRLPAAMRLLTAAGALAGVCQIAALIASRPKWGLATLGILFHAAGLLLFAWVLTSVPRRGLLIAHSHELGDGIKTGGPFAIFRHPCYAAYSLTWLGACVARPHPATIVPACVMITWYVLLARAEERRLMSSTLASVYARYRERVTWFGPNPIARRRVPVGQQ